MSRIVLPAGYREGGSVSGPDGKIYSIAEALEAGIIKQAEASMTITRRVYLRARGVPEERLPCYDTKDSVTLRGEELEWWESLGNTAMAEAYGADDPEQPESWSIEDLFPLAMMAVLKSLETDLVTLLAVKSALDVIMMNETGLTDDQRACLARAIKALKALEGMKVAQSVPGMTKHKAGDGAIVLSSDEKVGSEIADAIGKIRAEYEELEQSDD